MEAYRGARESLSKFKTAYPQWDPQVVSFRLRYLDDRLGNWPEPADEKPAPADSEVQALQRRVQFLERSGQQYQAQINQLLTENNRLSVRLREALAIRPAAQEPAAVMEVQTKLETAAREVERLQLRVTELETELAGIPKPDEARQNARLLDETRKSLKQALGEAEALRKQVAALRVEQPTVAEVPAAESRMDDLLQAARVAQSAAALELQRLRAENDQLQKQLAGLAQVSEPEAVPRKGAGSLNRADHARLAMAVGRWAEATELLEAEVATNDHNVEAWYLLGRSRLEAGGFTAAAAALKRALELSPELSMAHLEFARLYLRQPQPELALSRWHYHRAMGLGSPRDAALEKELAWEQPPAGQ
jgi:tetratricopeptide (TPR) repeat protein